MFDKKYEDRLVIWRNFRDELEVSESPFDDVIGFYSKVPYVSIVTDPWDQSSWLGPWELLHENQYCHFARVLGMCYSLQLTERFKDSDFEIHIGIDNTKSETYYLLYVDDVVLNYDQECIVNRQDLPNTLVSQRIYTMPRLQ